MSRRLVILAAAFVLAGAMSATAQVPKEQVPGASPAGSSDPAHSPANKRTPSPKPDPNFPKPEPVAPKAHPSDPPKLPGSGRQDVVPGS